MNGIEQDMAHLSVRKEQLNNAKQDVDLAQKIVGATIRLTRKQSGLSYRALAAKVGISIAFLNDIELGRRFPSEEVLKRIMQGLSGKVPAARTTKPAKRTAPKSHPKDI